MLDVDAAIAGAQVSLFQDQSGAPTRVSQTSGDGIADFADVADGSYRLLAQTLGRLYSSTYYALRDTRTPLRFAVVRVVLDGHADRGNRQAERHGREHTLPRLRREEDEEHP